MTAPSATALKATLLFIASLTVLSGAIIAPSLPSLVAYFISVGVVPKNAEFWGRMLMSIPALFILIFSPLMGYIIDRFGRRNVLFTGLVLYAITGAWGGVFPTIEVLIVTRMGLGLAVSMTMTTVMTLAGDYFKGQERQTFFGYFGSAMSFGGIIYFILGGFVAELNWRAPFFIYLIALVALILALWVIYEPQVEQEIPTQTKSVTKTPYALIALLYVTALSNMAIYYIVPLQIPFVLHDLGLTSTLMTGLCTASASIGVMLMAFQYGKLKRKFSHEVIFFIGFLSLALGYLLIDNFGFRLLGVILGLLLAGFGLGMIIPNSTTWLMNIAPAHLRGRLTGGLSSSINIGQFISPLLAFPIQQSHGNRAVYGFFAMASLIIAVIYFFLILRERKLS